MVAMVYKWVMIGNYYDYWFQTTLRRPTQNAPCDGRSRKPLPASRPAPSPDASDDLDHDLTSKDQPWTVGNHGPSYISYKL